MVYIYSRKVIWNLPNQFWKQFILIAMQILAKYTVCVNLNKCDFPRLPSPATRFKPLYSLIKCVGLVCKSICHLFKSFTQVYKHFCSTVWPTCSVPVSVSHSSLYQRAVSSAPCVSRVRIKTAAFPSHIPNICNTNALVWSFSSKLKSTPSLKVSFSFH